MVHGDMGTELALTIPGPEELGPKMLALRDDRQRRFVWAMLYSPNQTQAAKMAGYSDTGDGAKVRACNLMQSAAILDALHEVGWRRLHGAALKSIHALEAIVDDPAHPKHLHAVLATLDRTGFAAQTEHKVTVEHRVGDDQMKALAARCADLWGVSREKLLGNDVIEGEVLHQTAEAVDGESR
jgi:hypothetical protein